MTRKREGSYDIKYWFKILKRLNKINFKHENGKKPLTVINDNLIPYNVLQLNLLAEQIFNAYFSESHVNFSHTRASAASASVGWVQQPLCYIRNKSPGWTQRFCPCLAHFNDKILLLLWLLTFFFGKKSALFWAILKPILFHLSLLYVSPTNNVIE